MLTIILWWFLLSIPVGLITGRLISINSSNDEFEKSSDQN